MSFKLKTECNTWNRRGRYCLRQTSSSNNSKADISITTSKNAKQSLTNNPSSSPPIQSPLEIAQLASVWCKPFAAAAQIQSSAGIATIKLSEKTLTHVFGLNVEVKTHLDGVSFDSVSSTGYHFYGELTNPRGNNPNPIAFCDQYMNLFCRYALQGFISYRQNEMPKFKTMFSANMTRAKILTAWSESLQEQNITSVKKSGKKHEIQGVSPSYDGMTITTIVKGNGEVVTFYPEPVGLKSADKIKQQKSIEAMYTKHFKNPRNLPERQPLTEEELESLLVESKACAVIDNWFLAGVDDCSAAFYGGHAYPWKVYVWLTILNQTYIDELQRREHDVEIDMPIPPLSIPRSTLKKVFRKDTAANRIFPKYLTRVQIVRALVDALKNYAKKLTPEISFPSKQNQSLATGSANTILRSIPLPRVSEERNGDVSFVCTSRKQTYDDSWTFRVILDPDSGEIKHFAVCLLSADKVMM